MENAVRPILIALPERLEGERAVLRPYGQGDAQGLWEAIEESREHLRPWLPWVLRYSGPDDAREFVARARAGWLLREDHIPYAILDREDGRFVGGLGIHPKDWVIRRFELGYWLRRTAEGRGLMSDAVRLVTRLLFDELGAQRVEIRADPRDSRSVAVAKRLGFRYEGALRNAMADADGAPRGQAVYALLPEEYAALSWRREELPGAPTP